VRRFAQFSWTVLGFNILVILWGALVRASRSGEGCGDHWPLCNGTVIPHAAQIATIVEFTHRITTAIAFFSVVVMALWAFRRYRQEPVWPAAAASLALIITEALLGAGLVLFKFVGADVSIGRLVYLSAHLINTLLMLGAMALTAWWASGHHAVRLRNIPVRAVGPVILSAVGIAVTGVVTALSDTLYPASSLRAGFEADFASSSPMLVTLRIWHPMIAIVAGAYIAIAVSRIDRAPRLRHIAIALLGMELAAGMLNLYLLAPVWMQLIHLLLADLLWITLVLLGAVVLEKSPGSEPQSHRATEKAAVSF
jgi:cytochrome c oxidase assembly protein subunit 15